MREIAKKLKISYNGVCYSLQITAQMGSNQNRKRSGRPRCTTKQEDNYIRVFSLRNRRLTGPQLAASLNDTHKTPVSTSTVKRRVQDAGLGRVAKKKLYLRLANKRKRLSCCGSSLNIWYVRSAHQANPNLWEELQEVLGEISSDYLNKLTARMPKVCKAVIAANGELFDESKV